MPTRFSEGEVVKSTASTYTVEKVLSQGAFAHACRARSSSRGGVVFLKRYFSPAISLPWYPAFVAHQKELKKRVMDTPSVKQYSYEFIDFFEGTEGRANRTFHQVFEFVDKGKPLSDFLSEFASRGDDVEWDTRVRFARVMMMGIAALHSQKIVHTDLKPDNILLIPNPVSANDYHLKVVDMDFAIFSDRKAPWDGEMGYVGTPMYQSPEHLAGRVPTERSDVFTCALMLGELLGGQHPFASSKDYGADVKAGRFKPFSLVRDVPKVTNRPYLESLINAALDPNASRRPTSEELRSALLGLGKAAEKSTEPPVDPIVKSPVEETRVEKTREEKPRPAASLEFQSEGKTVMRMTVETLVGKQMLKPAGPDSQFASDPQYRLHRDASGSWMISPVAGTVNETIVDGRKLTSPLPLRDGMRIAIGNSTKGIEKLPLVVRMH